MPDVADVTVKAKGNTSDAESKLSNLHKKLQDTGEAGSSAKPGILGMIGAFAGVEIAAKGFDFLKDQLSESITLGEEGEKTQALLANAIQATGNASGQTMAGLEAMAEHLSQVTTASKETVLGVEQIELRGKIPQNLFAGVTQSALDMSAAMGTSATQAANVLTKALDNPATAAGALRRAHITLTAEEQAGIKADLARGDSLAAQKTILEAVQSSYKGAAAAVGDTFAGKMQILQNTMENAKEKIGEALIPVLSSLLTKITPLLTAFADWLPTAINAFSGAITAVQPVLDTVEDKIEVVFNFLGTHKEILAAIGIGILATLVPAFVAWAVGAGAAAVATIAAAAPVIAIGIAIAALAAGIIYAYEHWTPFRVAVQTVGEALKTLWGQITTGVTVLVDFWKSHWDTIKAVLTTAWDLIKGEVQIAIAYVTGIIKIGLDLIHGNWSGVWNDIKNMLGGIWDGIQTATQGAVGRLVNGVVTWFQQLPQKIYQAGQDMINAFINGIKSLAGNVASVLGNVIHGAVSLIPGGSQLAHLAGIPGFASGTEFAPAGIAVVGEGSEPELVVGPHLAALPQGAGVYPISQLPYAQSTGHSDGGPIVVNLVLDGDLLTQAVLRRTPKQVWYATGLRGAI